MKQWKSRVIVLVLLLCSVSLVTGWEKIKDLPAGVKSALYMEMVNPEVIRVKIENQEKLFRLAGIDYHNYYCDPVFRMEGSFWFETMHFNYDGQIYYKPENGNPVDANGIPLVYVYLPSGLCINQELIMGGYVGADTERTYAGKNQCIAWMNWAKKNYRGMWPEEE